MQSILSFFFIYIYIYICMCVYVVTERHGANVTLYRCVTELLLCYIYLRWVSSKRSRVPTSQYVYVLRFIILRMNIYWT